MKCELDMHVGRHMVKMRKKNYAAVCVRSFFNHNKLLEELKHGCRQMNVKHYTKSIAYYLVGFLQFCLRCFDAVGWAAGRASGL